MTRRAGFVLAPRAPFAPLVPFALAALASCAVRPPPSDPELDPLAELRAFEGARRDVARFETAPPSDAELGADPYALAPLGGGFAGLLRGRDALVALGADLRETARASTVHLPSALAVYAGPRRAGLEPGDVLVVGAEPRIAIHRGVAPIARALELPGVVRARDVVVGPEGVIYVADEEGDRVLWLDPSRARRGEVAVPAGPLRLARTRGALWVLSLLGHSLTALAVGPDGAPGARIASRAFDGPLWALGALDVPGGELVIATGVEDHPLDRREGFFGYVDSFVYGMFRPTGSARPGALAATFALDASDLGVVVPKALAFTAGGAAPEVVVSAGGSPAALVLAFRDGPEKAPKVEVRPALPGASALAIGPAGLVAANPLLDAWVAPDGIPTLLRDGTDARRSERSRVGEALFFTELIAAGVRSDGPRSRFTCETCHFEGGVDGRTHHTGRGDVRATTKPLFGLFPNRPHFSRALDPDLSAVAENELAVAARASGLDPHFAIDAARAPWLAHLIAPGAVYDPTEVRRAFVQYAIDASPAENPRVRGRSRFDALERAGAVAFAERCERCHEARLVAADPRTRVPFERWEELVFARGTILWASDAYERTGIEPTVHELGARVPSLRRLGRKRPYFTNGSSPSLDDVLARVRWEGGRFDHDGRASPERGERLDPGARAALRAFVLLL